MPSFLATPSGRTVEQPHGRVEPSWGQGSPSGQPDPQPAQPDPGVSPQPGSAGHATNAEVELEQPELRHIITSYPMALVAAEADCREDSSVVDGGVVAADSRCGSVFVAASVEFGSNSLDIMEDQLSVYSAPTTIGMSEAIDACME